jgi:hypothetical protein
MDQLLPFPGLSCFLESFVTGEKMDAAMGLLEWVMVLVDHGWDIVIQRGHAQDWPHIVLAYALAFPIGWERGKNYNIAGLRTFPIVAMASCGYALGPTTCRTSVPMRSPG